jgi:dienelactone hydrolase
MLSLAAITALTLADASALEPKARTMVDQLSHGDFKSARAGFSDKMLAAMSEEMLAAAWASLPGKLKLAGTVRYSHEQGYDIITLPLTFEHGVVDARVVFDGSAKVAGLFFKPHEEELAKEFLAQLTSGDFEGATKTFDTSMRQSLPAPKLAEVWKPLGKLLSAGAPKVQRVAQYRAVLVPCRFEKGLFTVKVVYDGALQVAGLFIVDGDLTETWSPPPYAGPSHEREISVGAQKLPGRLTLPEGKGPFPAVVLVHGSGAHDEDETIGPNKPFKDLALGLASRGVVVLRYVKRSKVAPKTVATVRDEVVDDAVAGIDVLKAQPEVDAKRIAVVGHSLGGYLVPWILKERPEVSGVMLAGSARGTMDLVVEQYTYFASLNPNDAAAQKGVEEAKAKKARVEAKDLKPDEVVFGAPGSWWLSVRDYKPVETAAALKARLLVLQGERDYQVQFKTDFAAYKKALKDHSGVTLISYPKLNHLFIAGEGPSTPAEHDRPAHVDAEVVQDIAKWMASATSGTSPAKGP